MGQEVMNPRLKTPTAVAVTKKWILVSPSERCNDSQLLSPYRKHLNQHTYMITACIQPIYIALWGKIVCLTACPIIKGQAQSSKGLMYSQIHI